jgi:hypothetical protein
MGLKNKERKGIIMDTAKDEKLIRELKNCSDDLINLISSAEKYKGKLSPVISVDELSYIVDRLLLIKNHAV